MSRSGVAPQDWHRTIAKTETLSYVWNVEGIDALRKLARLKALPSKDRLFSPEFGNKDVGFWKVALFPYGDRDAGKHVSLYLFGDKKGKRVAEFSMVVLDKEFREIPDTYLGEEPTFFTADSNSWGWHEFLSVENDEELKPYLVDANCLRVKILVKVYTGVEDDESPRLLVNIVQHRCDQSEEDEDEDDCCTAEDWMSDIAEAPNSGNESFLHESSGLSSGGYNNVAAANSARTACQSGCSGQPSSSPLSSTSTTRHWTGAKPATAGGTATGSSRNPPSSGGAPDAAAPLVEPVLPSSGLSALSASCAVSGGSSGNRRNCLADAAGSRASLGRNLQQPRTGNLSSKAGMSLAGRRKSTSALANNRVGHRAVRRIGRHSSCANCCCGCCCSTLSSSSAAAPCSTSSKRVNSSGIPGGGGGTVGAGGIGVESSEINICGRSIQTDVSRFALDPRILDTAVICEGIKFRANRFMLAARSDVFRAMLFGDFREGRQDEIHIRDVPIDCVEDFLTFIATDSCPTLMLPFRCECGCSNGATSAHQQASHAMSSGGKLPTSPSDGEQCANHRHLHSTPSADAQQSGTGVDLVATRDAVLLVPKLLNLLAAADKYQILELRSRCIQLLARCICARTVLDVLEGAELLNCDALAEACQYYLKNNSTKVSRIVSEIRNRERRRSSASTAASLSPYDHGSMVPLDVSPPAPPAAHNNSSSGKLTQFKYSENRLTSPNSSRDSFCSVADPHKSSVVMAEGVSSCCTPLWPLYTAAADHPLPSFRTSRRVQRSLEFEDDDHDGGEIMMCSLTQ